MNTSKVTRLEVIDHSPCRKCTGQGGTEFVPCHGCGGSGFAGRSVVFWDKNKQLSLELQDDDQTLKIFIDERISKEK